MREPRVNTGVYTEKRIELLPARTEEERFKSKNS